MVQSPFSMCWSSSLRCQNPPRMQALLNKTRWFLAEMIRDVDRYGLVWKYGTAPRYAMCFLGKCRWFSDGMGMTFPHWQSYCIPGFDGEQARKDRQLVAGGFQLIWCGIPCIPLLGIIHSICPYAPSWLMGWFVLPYSGSLIIAPSWLMG